MIKENAKEYCKLEQVHNKKNDEKQQKFKVKIYKEEEKEYNYKKICKKIMFLFFFLMDWFNRLNSINIVRLLNEIIVGSLQTPGTLLIISKHSHKAYCLNALVYFC